MAPSSSSSNRRKRSSKRKSVSSSSRMSSSTPRFLHSNSKSSSSSGAARRYSSRSSSNKSISYEEDSRRPTTAYPQPALLRESPDDAEIESRSPFSFRAEKTTPLFSRGSAFRPKMRRFLDELQDNCTSLRELRRNGVKVIKQDERISVELVRSDEDVPLVIKVHNISNPMSYTQTGEDYITRRVYNKCIEYSPCFVRFITSFVCAAPGTKGRKACEEQLKCLQNKRTDCRKACVFKAVSVLDLAGTDVHKHAYEFAPRHSVPAYGALASVEHSTPSKLRPIALSIMMQVLPSLLALQNVATAMHNDLHGGNIMVVASHRKQKKYYRFQFQNGKRITAIRVLALYTAKIIDFGLGIMQVGKRRVQGYDLRLNTLRHTQRKIFYDNGPSVYTDAHLALSSLGEIYTPFKKIANENTTFNRIFQAIQRMAIESGVAEVVKPDAPVLDSATQREYVFKPIPVSTKDLVVKVDSIEQFRQYGRDYQIEYFSARGRVNTVMPGSSLRIVSTSVSRSKTTK